MFRMLGLLAPETSHRLALLATRLGMYSRTPAADLPRLRISMAGLEMPNPVGIAAGVDKQVLVPDRFLGMGFGHVEVGCITPEPQPGNPRPRLFRLNRDAALINRMGLNNVGAAIASNRLSRLHHEGTVGINIGPNTVTSDPVGDYARVTETCGRHASYITVNISCPNQKTGFRPDDPEILRRLLAAVLEVRECSGIPAPVFVKLSPELSSSHLEDIVYTSIEAPVAGFVATNTMTGRGDLTSAAWAEEGGLSGTPLFEKSTRVLARVYKISSGRVPIIGVGGIGSAGDAITKLRAGATAVQLYTALTYKGTGLLAAICRGIDRHLEENGHASPMDITGKDHLKWL